MRLAHDVRPPTSLESLFAATGDAETLASPQMMREIQLRIIPTEGERSESRRRITIRDVEFVFCVLEAT